MNQLGGLEQVIGAQCCATSVANNISNKLFQRRSIFFPIQELPAPVFEIRRCRQFAALFHLCHICIAAGKLLIALQVPSRPLVERNPWFALKRSFFFRFPFISLHFFTVLPSVDRP